MLSVEKRRACTCFLSNIILIIILLFNLCHFFQLNVKGLDLNVNHWNLTLGCTSKVIPPPWYKGGGDGPPLEFFICCSISKRFCFQSKAFDLLYKMRYILWVVLLLMVCDIAKLGRHLGFYHQPPTKKQPPPPPRPSPCTSDGLKVLKFWLFMICFT